MSLINQGKKVVINHKSGLFLSGVKNILFKTAINKSQTLSYVLREEIFSILKISDKKEEKGKECMARKVGEISWDTFK